MVKTYKAIACCAKHGNSPLEIVLQALSAQNMADMVRTLYGSGVVIFEISEIKEDWK